MAKLKIRPCRTRSQAQKSLKGLAISGFNGIDSQGA